MRIGVKTVMLGLLACAFFCAGVFASEGRLRIDLKSQAVLTGEVFSLCDVAKLPRDVPADVKNTVLGNTPWPGHARRVTRALIRMRLASKGIGPEKLTFGGAEHCRVSVDTVRIEPEKIVAAARRCVEERLKDGKGAVSVELLNKVDPMVVEGGKERPKIRATMHGSSTPLGRVRVRVTATRSQVRLAQTSVSFEVRLTVRVAVARTRIQAGEELSAEKVDFQKRDVSTSQGGWIGSADDLAGKTAARSIGPGEIVTRRMLENTRPPVVIDFHERVYLVVENSGLRAVTLGRALCKARRGRVARAENLATGREVVGVAAGDSTIKVQMEECRNGS